MSAAQVAAAWATIAGWMRISGHVTPVPIRKVSVACAMPPIVVHTNGLCPVFEIHGWMWFGDQPPREAGLLRERRVADEVARAVLLAREGVADVHEASGTTGARP